MSYLIPEDIFIERLNWSLDRKIQESWKRIEEWVKVWGKDASLALSGGLDSTVLRNLIRTHPKIDGKGIPNFFSDTGCEYPEIRRFIMSLKGVTWIVPNTRYHKVVKKYGYPVVSKEISLSVRQVMTTQSPHLVKLRLSGLKRDGTFTQAGVIPKKWQFLIGAPFKISEKCCDCLKKNPMKKCGIPMMGIRATESRKRKTLYQSTGCNAFDQKSPRSWPIAFWTDQDIWNYINAFKIRYSEIYDMGYTRTGCFPCAFGIDREEWPNRYQLMEKTHPRLWDLCLDRYGMQRVFDYINKHLPAKQRISYRWSDYQEAMVKNDAKEKQLSFNFAGTQNGTKNYPHISA